MQRLRITRQVASIDELDVQLETCDLPTRAANEVLVQIRAAGVNRSDVAAVLGRMPQAVWPRTPGRDWAGVVVEGPPALVGQECFGAGGDLGVTRDGTHATHLVVHRDAAGVKPAALALAGAGGLGGAVGAAPRGFR